MMKSYIIVYSVRPLHGIDRAGLAVRERGRRIDGPTTQSRENPHAAATGDRRRLSAGYGGGTPPVRGFRMVDAGGRSGALIDLRPFGRNRSSPAALQPRLWEQLF